MGNFWDNATKEFGKKTGKALGNKLYGKHADDVRKRIAISRDNDRSMSGTQPSIDYEAIERAKQSALEHEHDIKLLDTIVAIEFKTKDIDGIVKNLTFLSTSVDSWLMQSDKKKHAMAARSQFKTGLAVLAAVNAEHPLLPYFSTKEQEWRRLVRNKTIQSALLWTSLLLGPWLLLYILSLFGLVK